MIDEDGEDLPEIDDVVQVETWINVNGGIDRFSPEIASWLPAVWCSWDWTRGWIGQRVSHELIITTFDVHLIKAENGCVVIELPNCRC